MQAVRSLLPSVLVCGSQAQVECSAAFAPSFVGSIIAELAIGWRNGSILPRFGESTVVWEESCAVLIFSRTLLW